VLILVQEIITLLVVVTMKNFASFTRPNLSERTYNDSRSSISVQSMGRTIFLTPDTITFLEGEGNYTFIYTNTERNIWFQKH
jgi:two-component system LytT family response regulator